MYHHLKENINQVGVYTPEEFDVLVSKLEVAHLAKGSHFLKEGQVCSHIAFIEKGLAMYFKVVDGTEIPLDFGIENQWLSYLKSFTERTPSDMNIKVLEDSVLFTLEFKQMQELMTMHPKFLALRSYYVEKSLAEVTQHSANLATLDAKQRYYQLMKEKPHLINRVPQYLLAAYLGIQPQSLSRIRKEFNPRS